MMLDPAIWIFSRGEHRALEGTKGRQGVEKCLNGDACHISDKVHLLLTPRGKDRQREWMFVERFSRCRSMNLGRV